MVNLNVDEIDQIVELCCQLGVDCLIVGRLIDAGNAKLNKNELEVDAETIFAAAQSLLSKTVEHPELDIHINFLKPKIVEYFNLKNNANVQIHYSACHSITTTAYIQSDGTVLPCACLLTDGNADLASDMLRDSKRITEYSIDGIWESASFNDMVATIRNRKIDDNYTSCNMCKFNKRACNPCPMVNLSKQSVSMDLCQVAEKALATL